MQIRDYFVRPENLPRIRALGYIRFVLFYGVLPATLFATAVFPAYRWFTTRHSIYSSILDYFDFVRHSLLLSPLLGLLLGT
ncbi:MAG: hypothetical protein GF393_09145, partial [Armatimonadia bacterium]|nr:hypothetical protein [Armatimonadia bacterium]